MWGFNHWLHVQWRILFLAAGALSWQKVSSCHSRLLKPSAISPSCENSASHQQQILSNCLQLSYFWEALLLFFIFTHVARETKTMGFVIWALALTLHYFALPCWWSHYIIYTNHVWFGCKTACGGIVNKVITIRKLFR